MRQAAAFVCMPIKEMDLFHFAKFLTFNESSDIEHNADAAAHSLWKQHRKGQTMQRQAVTKKAVHFSRQSGNDFLVYSDLNST